MIRDLRLKSLALPMAAGLLASWAVASAPAESPKAPSATRTGKDAMGDWTTDAPGVRRKLTVEDLPRPFDTSSAKNQPKVVKRPEGAWPKAPEGFKVEEFATGLNNPRVLMTAPNGDIFLAESMANRIKVLRDADGDGKPESTTVFAEKLGKPFGIAFYPPGPEPTHVYVANTDSVVRFPYKNGETKATAGPETIVARLPGFAQLTGGGHWTRDVAFSADGKRMFVSIGSKSNNDDNEAESRRADILVFDPEGKGEKVYASGIRNPVGLAVQPGTGILWTSVNERDGLGDHLVPDYVTHVEEGGFYGWPWYYIGGHEDPRYPGKHPELKGKVIVPDVILQSHSASLDLAFYTGDQFPDDYKGDIFAAEHGSWNRDRRTGYKVIRVPLKDGKATGEYEDFLTGFVTPEGDVWGRPVGVTVARDGALLVSDDGSGTIWRISATKAKVASK